MPSRNYQPEEVVTVTAFETLRETDKAWLIYFEEANEEVWVPKSQILAGDPEYDEELELPRWLAETKGIVE